jgi:alpha-galactosidase
VAKLEHQPVDLSNAELEYRLGGSEGYGLVHFGLPGLEPWTRDGAAPFAVYANGRQSDSRDNVLDRVDVTTTDLPDGSRHTVMVLLWSSTQLEIEDHTVLYAGTALVERWQTVRNAGATTIGIDRLDSVCLSVPSERHEIMFFESGWGREFEPKCCPLEEVSILESRSGRSSQTTIPWFALVRPDGQILSATVMWSGNWIIRFEPGLDGTYRVTGGLNDWEFFKSLAPGKAMESPHVAVALGTNRDFNAVSAQFARVGRRHWYPRAPLASTLPVEWNHWWAYGDREVSEAVFLRNAEHAATIGIEVCTLDAGWFGPDHAEAHWFAHRGDWNSINSARFPRGIRPLADRIHQLGMKFGLWCEIEALGEQAHLAQTRSDLPATRDAVPLGYVCFGNPAAREWAYSTLARLITDYAADWIKLDFNLDPGAGCSRTDHGHGAGDGLYEHYLGLYETLERIRRQYPEVVLENCSSGGLRTDLGMLRQTHLTFLSDPDWPEHSLQVFWGASCFLASDVLLHWAFSPGLGERPHQTFDPWRPDLTQRHVDFYLRVAMLHACGLSQRLPELPEWVKARFAVHIALYKGVVRRFLRSADLHRLTKQPIGERRGDRWTAFQYIMPDRLEHLVFVFRLSGAAGERTLQLAGLNPDRTYILSWLGEDRTTRRRGAELLRDGLEMRDLSEEESALILIQQADAIVR